MGLLDDIGAGLSKMGETVEGAVNTGGKQFDLTALNNKIREANAELGQQVYGLRSQGTTFDASLQPTFEKLDGLYAQAAALQAEIDAAKAAPAPQPGAAPAPAPAAAPAAPATCTCGETLQPGAKFCPGCGASVE